MGRQKINEEDRIVGIRIAMKSYVRDNINNDPAAMQEILSFIEERWGTKDTEKYDNARKAKRIEWLERHLKADRARLSELEIETEHGEKSSIYKMMSGSVIKRISKFEAELSEIESTT